MSDAMSVTQKYPETFWMEIPKVALNGRAEFDKQGQPKFQKYIWPVFVLYDCASLVLEETHLRGSTRRVRSSLRCE